jgi:hypothetical protein
MLDEKMLDLDGQLAHAYAGRVVDRRSRRGGEAGQADLADATCAKFINLRVGEVEEMYANRRDVGVDRHDVVGQIAVDRRAVLTRRSIVAPRPSRTRIMSTS